MSHVDNNPWGDYALLSQRFHSMTIPRILDLIRMVNSEMQVNIKQSQGLKAEICQRLDAWLAHWKTTNDVSKWAKYKEIYSRFEHAGRYGGSPAAAAAYSYPSGSIAAPRPPAPAYNYPAANAYTWQQPQNAAAGPAAIRKPVVKWKDSPLFKVVEAVTDIVFLKESVSQNDRQAATASFQLTEDVRQRLERSLLAPTTAPRLSLRLFCTSSTYYTQSGATHAGLGGLPMEFPQTSEVRVNASLISANLKGMKKKPGSCPPADLQKGKAGETRLVRMGRSDLNKVELVHVNSLGPQHVKRYWMQVCLIESTTPAELVTQVKNQPRKSRADVVAGMQQDAVDAEIQIGALTLNLKCPLSYVRMSTPVRSNACDHLQCFEASSWFQINEQTPQWACPICERVLAVKELFIDQFTEEIINACPDSIDEVLVEPDGLWHSSNRKYGSAAWLAAHPFIPSQPGSDPASRTSTPLADVSSKGKAKEVFTLSSDDDDDDDRPPPPRATSSAAPRRSVPVAMDGPIDLTLSSDDEDARPPPRPAQRSSSSVVPNGGLNGSLKRSSEGDAGGAEKRARTDGDSVSSHLPVPTGSSSGSAASDLRAQALASSLASAPSSALPNHYSDPSQGGLRGGASSSSSSYRDPKTDHPSFDMPSSHRRRDDDDDGSSSSFLLPNSSYSSSRPYTWRAPPPRDLTTGKYTSASSHLDLPTASSMLHRSSPSSSSPPLEPPVLPSPSFGSRLPFSLPPLPPTYPNPRTQPGGYNLSPDLFGMSPFGLAGGGMKRPEYDPARYGQSSGGR